MGIEHRDRLKGEFRPIRPRWRVEEALAGLGRWRGLARGLEATRGVGDRVDSGRLRGLAAVHDLEPPVRARTVGWSHLTGIIIAVISSRVKAKKYGPGWLLVDGTDETVVRKAGFAFKPSQSQAARLERLLGACCEVYNAALQERREAWRLQSKSIALFDQFNQIKDLRGVRDDVLTWGIQPLRGALRRLDEAFCAFYRRSRAGQTPGYPRFKSQRRFDTVCWDEPTSWRVELDSATLWVQGVGAIKLSKSARRQLTRLAGRGGVAVTLTVTRARSGRSWRACVGFKEVAATKMVPAGGAEAVIGGDRGTVVTLALSDGRLLAMPKFLNQARQTIAELQRLRAAKKKGSREWRRLGRQVAKAYRKAKQQSDNWARHTAGDLIARYGVVVLEDLKLTNMTRSARGTVEAPGTNVKAKQQLNRRLADAALGRLRHWICVKAEEAGRRTWVVPAHNTSRRCAACNHVAKTNRDRARFHCRRCGLQAHADINAAENIAASGRDCEAAWTAAGRPPLPRPKPRLQRRTATPQPKAAPAA